MYGLLQAVRNNILNTAIEADRNHFYNSDTHHCDSEFQWPTS